MDSRLIPREMPANLGKTAFCAYIWCISEARFGAGFSRRASGIQTTGFHERSDRQQQRR
ncbi:hypothetical protein [Mesorhizobium sp.]|uniref:hypothetical protein n=1 Tax=Mesorhizobium sp. TaxID=1871066 RepID=UPI0025F3B5EE|nr:hypothetical protein [Mesorhizobium sp.]